MNNAIKKESEFSGEFYKEILQINGKKYEHVGFKSNDGSFEKMFNSLADENDLPLKAVIKIELINEQ